MSSPTVRERPSAYNTFMLDGQRCPGISVPSGGEAKEKIDDQRQPLTTGANTVVQFSENEVVTYTLTLWEIGHLQAWNAWEAMFLDGRSRRPPRVYSIVDLRASWLKKVVFQSMGMQAVENPGGPWTRTLVLHAWKRIKPYGGPVKPGFLDAQIAAVQADTATLRAQQAATSTQVAHMPSGKPGK